ncbi:MAG: pyridoxamine 5'-phosphate oxidase family protein [Candidatus Omnitrophica bacterium]|nr:pyridoxamine 5'-phosphate oxidase family protein [Candidatus Omnitrophota bacterium]
MDADLKKEALEFARSANVSVLATVSKTKGVNARVMQIVKVDDDMTVWYSSLGTTDKISEVKGNPRVCVVMSNYKIMTDMRYHGTIEIITDQKTKDRFWRDEWVRFYPKGKTDPDYVIMKFVPNAVEFRNMKKYGMVAKKLI